jgi:LCP family protein required for cell wall assembly
VVRLVRIVLVATTASSLLAACGWFSDEATEGPTPSAPTGSPTAEPETFELVMDLRGYAGRGPDGPVRRRSLKSAARQVRDALERVYSIGFVDPTEWDDGRFPDLADAFAGDARGTVPDDLDALTLGPAARVVDAVRPERARVDVRFLTDAAKRPAAAFATASFEGTAIAGPAELRVRHEGEYTLRKVDARWRVVAYDVRGRVPTPQDVRGKVRAAASAPQVPANDLLFLLVIGSDARPGQPVARARADSLHIIGINPRLGRASIVGIPRDSFVAIPGYGTDKINASLVRGGPELVVTTVERLAGIPIDAYVLTGFEGFKRVVTAVGGIPVNVPYLMSEPAMPTLRPGRTRLNGRRALAFSRNRHDAPGGDFGRSLNQGRLLAAALGELQRDLRQDPADLVRWTIAAARYLDTDLTFAESLELLLASGSIDADRVRNAVVSGSGRTIGGRSVVILGQRARAVFRDLAADAILRG